jgi:murein DD-endopeptidase MepM/ murein hydrolase activator NlpD
VAESENSAQATVAFEDSWMQSRTFGGSRGHEGCDIMASINQRGYYPIVSVSDGTVEKIGWLTQGGYRIGIRSKHGAFFYYAHLYDYARDFKEGDSVVAGELIGFMGDSGYSNIEGTVGNFDVHLHFGIYLNDASGKEFSVNSYCVLDQIKDKRYACKY